MTSESAKRVAQASRSSDPISDQPSDSYGRTDVRTNEELLDLGGYLTSRNAHDDSRIDPEVATVRAALTERTAP